MGYMCHHTVIVTTWDAMRARVAHEKATEIFAPLGNLVTPIIESRINGYFTFAVAPDGSKEGWDESDRGDRCRADLIGWLEAQRYEDRSSPYDWAEVQYGDDERETIIVRHSDEGPAPA